MALLAQTSSQTDIKDRLRDLEQWQKRFEKQLEEREARIRELESEAERNPSNATSLTNSPGKTANKNETNPFGEFTPGKGFTVARTELGELQISLYTYLRHLNQQGLDDQYEGELFYRMLDNFRTNAPLGIDKLIDKGAQVKTSTMVLPKILQLYVNGSKIFGEYGDPWDSGIGINWWPFKQRGLRINSEAIYLKKSPVGNSSLPYTIGANG